MDNISILNFFTPQANLELPKMTDSSSSGQFENVFKNYLDRSSDTSVKTDTAKQDQKSVKAEEPETPEEVIDNLDISEDQKAELKRMLEEADSEEDIKNFVDELMAAVQDESEEVLTQLAMSILGSDTERTAQDSMLLEESLDQIAAVQKAESRPQLTLVTDNTNVSVDADSSEDESADDTLMTMAKEKNSEQLSSEMKAKIMEVVAEKAGEKTTSATDSTEQTFTLKSENTEKVLTTEVKIESPKDIMKFADLVELAKSQKVNKLTVQLTPQELGRVNIELTEHAGKVSGKVVFESENAKHLFTTNAEALKQQLADKGIVVENLEFIFKDFDNSEFAGWENREGKKGGNDAAAGLIEDEAEEETEDTDGIYA